MDAGEKHEGDYGEDRWTQGGRDKTDTAETVIRVKGQVLMHLSRDLKRSARTDNRAAFVPISFPTKDS